MDVFLRAKKMTGEVCGRPYLRNVQCCGCFDWKDVPTRHGEGSVQCDRWERRDQARLKVFLVGWSDETRGTSLKTISWRLVMVRTRRHLSSTLVIPCVMMLQCTSSNELPRLLRRRRVCPKMRHHRPCLPCRATSCDVSSLQPAPLHLTASRHIGVECDV